MNITQSGIKRQDLLIDKMLLNKYTIVIAYLICLISSSSRIYHVYYGNG